MPNHLTEAQERELFQAEAMRRGWTLGDFMLGAYAGWLAKADATTSAASEVDALTDMARQLVADTREVFGKDGHDVVEYVGSWLTVFIDKRYRAESSLAARPVAQADAGALPEPAWLAVETPGADFDVSFVHTMDDALVLNDGDPDAATYIEPLFTGDQVRECIRSALAASAQATQADRLCTHPLGCTHCNWCGFRATQAVEPVAFGVISHQEK